MVIYVGRRHRMEIVADILRNAKGGIQKTPLVYLTNINFTLLKKYQSILVEKGLVESTNGQICSTEAGIEFLRKYEELMKRARSRGVEIEDIKVECSKNILEKGSRTFTCSRISPASV
jgi:predicted transcriptional regulator